MEFFHLKELVNDFSKENILDYVKVLNCLKNIYNEQYELIFLLENFKEFIKSLPSTINIYIIKDNDKIVGSGSLVIEKNISQDIRIGHIEDINILNKQGFYEEKLILFLKGKASEFNCSKVVFS